jgi:hypothetical protein
MGVVAASAIDDFKNERREAAHVIMLKTISDRRRLSMGRMVDSTNE